MSATYLRDVNRYDSQGRLIQIVTFSCPEEGSCPAADAAQRRGDLGQHPNDIPGILTRGEIWARISIGLLLGVSLAVAKSGMEREDRKRSLRGLGSARKGWDAARRKQTSTAKSYKPGPYDDWTDEELWEKAKTLLLGPNKDYLDGAWYGLDSTWTKAVSADPKKYCWWYQKKLQQVFGQISQARSIWNTGRIRRFAMVEGRAAVDFDLLDNRVKEVVQAVEQACGLYTGPVP